MSIQIATPKNLSSKIGSGVSIIAQIFSRGCHASKPKVFFRYRTQHTHPTFDRFYDHPPVAWANVFDFDLAHWINYPAFINDAPFVIEANDHPLSAVSFRNRGMCEPEQILAHLCDAEKVYADHRCKRILVPCQGFIGLFAHYFGDDFNDKILQVHSPGCMPRPSLHMANEGEPLVFCCLASDYLLKGVDIVIDAWLSLPSRRKARLILACPNVPQDVATRLTPDTGISLVAKAPLTRAEKHDILHQASVTLAPTHVHGGGNIVEGMEYGHAVIHFEIHSTAFDPVGEKILVPYHFYLPSHYGRAWKTFAEFCRVLKADKAAGQFEHTKEALAKSIMAMIDDTDQVCVLREKVYALACGRYSLQARNDFFLNLYRSLANDDE